MSWQNKCRDNIVDSSVADMLYKLGQVLLAKVLLQRLLCTAAPKEPADFYPIFTKPNDLLRICCYFSQAIRTTLKAVLVVLQR